jgi:polyisoprenyl-phosphate glycosyltransferase
MTKQLITVIVPIYNEAPNLHTLYRTIVSVTDQLPYSFEFVFVDDGSRDGSAARLYALAKADSRVHVIEFARNFGKEAAISAGLHAAHGDAAIMLDGDLQHPPELIGDFIEKWHSGADVVVGVRAYGKSDSWFKKFTSGTFYKIMSVISHTAITPHATDYRLVDRRVIDAFAALTERSRLTRGLIDWLGFQRDYVHFQAAPRQNGKRGYSYRKLVGLAMHSFTSFSLFPLKFAGYMGVVLIFTAGPLGLFVYIEKYIMGDPMGLQFTGTAMLALMLLFSVGVILACLGLVAMYIARIHIEVMNRPLYVVRPSRVMEEEEL